MKAVRLHRQGGPEQLVYEDAPEPGLGAGDALIRVHAMGITPAELTWAETYTNCDGSARLPAIPGHEASGVVASVADGVGEVSIGDEVYALTSFCRDGAAAALIDSGAIRPVIAETIPLAKARQAFERGVAGHTRGKLVLQVTTR
jgi:NADPH:quinone reductase-like Zn-dependent oxidoreductase